MTPLDPVFIRESFDAIRASLNPVLHDDDLDALIGSLERRLMLAESLLAMQARMDALAETFSRRVADVPALRLVGGDVA